MDATGRRQRPVRRGITTILTGALIASAGAVLAAGPARAAVPQHLTFPTGGPYEWTVPEGVTSATFELYGAAGGQGFGEAASRGGGGRGHLVVTLPVTPGDTYWITAGGRGAAVGQDGAGGFNGGGAGGLSYHGSYGGGGGGATDVRHGGTDLDDRILVAGGGGGDSGTGVRATIGADGGAGSAGPTAGGGADFHGAPGGWWIRGGGAGSGTVQGYGGVATETDTSPVRADLSGSDGAAGTGGAGGNGAADGGGGGGGGGGWFGGGGGAASGTAQPPGAGGGGGSGYAAPGIDVTTAGTAASNGPGVVFVDFAQPEASVPAISGEPPAGVLGEDYSFGFTALGYPAPRCAAIGSLPAGLALDPATCTLSGRPTAIGTYPFTVTATNPDGASSVDVTVAVTGRAPTIVATPAGGWPVDEPIDTGFLVDGDPAPTVVLESGQLPDGVQLTPAGWLTGTPTVPGSYTFTVRAANGTEPDATATVTIGIADRPRPPSIGGTPPAGEVGQDYDFRYTLDGNPVGTAAVTAGELPPGLGLTAQGRLVGTPVRPGTFQFTVTLDNGRDPAASVSSTVEIAPQPETTSPASTARPTVDVSCAAVVEGDWGRRRLTFVVTLSEPSSVPVTVKWRTANGTAEAGRDYVAGSGRLTFAPGQTHKVVRVWVRGDRMRERTETVRLRLSSPRGATLGHAVSRGYIRNDD